MAFVFCVARYAGCMNPPFRVFTFLVLLAFSACTGQDVHSRIVAAVDIAARAGMTAQILTASPFRLQSWHRGGANAMARVYIEGDGFAYISLGRISSDPTPRYPIALQLAAVDNAPLVIYLARPCQFVLSDVCAPKYWTTARTSPEVIAAYDAVITQIKSEYAVQRFELVGYSGGAAVAALVAARRSDIANLRTVAGNLDYAEFVHLHDVSPMHASLDPITVAPQLTKLPQIHFVGGEDEVVPPAIAEAWRKGSGQAGCIQNKTISDMEHNGNWAAAWAALLTNPVGCAE